MGVYQSALPWDPARPDTAIITCVDGRWYHHFQEFARVQLKAGPRTDFLAVPGGIEPLCFAAARTVPYDHLTSYENLDRETSHEAKNDHLPNVHRVCDGSNRWRWRICPRTDCARPAAEADG